MFDYAVSKHPHFDEACRQLPARHNVTALAKQIGMNAQTLRNKLSPGQPHQLTCAELLVIPEVAPSARLTPVERDRLGGIRADLARHDIAAQRWELEALARGAKVKFGDISMQYAPVNDWSDF